MIQKKESKKKAPNWVIYAILAPIAIFSLIDEMDGETAIILFFVFLVLVAAIVVTAIKLAVKRNQGTPTHSHDRIDHRTDLKINPKTGKAVNAPQNVREQHSAKEHWKQQLDGLLANGTIDRAEYRAMMNRKF